MHGAMHANSPRYLGDRVTSYAPYPRLRSADQALVVVLLINQERFGRRAISFAGPSLWNSFPLHLRTQRFSGPFTKDLNTFSFKQADLIVYIIMCIVLL